MHETDRVLAVKINAMPNNGRITTGVVGKITARIISVCVCSTFIAFILANFSRCQSLNTQATINFITFSYTSQFFSLCYCCCCCYSSYLCSEYFIFITQTGFDCVSTASRCAGAFTRLEYIVLCMCACVRACVYFIFIQFTLLILFSFLFIVIVADCMASCRYANHIDDTNARNHQKSSNGRHTRRETRLAIENTRCERVGQGMVYGKLSNHFSYSRKFIVLKRISNRIGIGLRMACFDIYIQM